VFTLTTARPPGQGRAGALRPSGSGALRCLGLQHAAVDLVALHGLEQGLEIAFAEAFAVVAEKYQRDLNLDRDKVNVNGGAIALGHPIGATGAMLIGTVLDELERQDKQFGLVTMCAAGGMAPAIIIERI
jgi:acetyl-CoA acetyltransferase